ncbi:DUF777 family protein [Borreliella garinii]|uniref:DUF777 family protein n=1 Tax=Borreliella garinii TaxID=29519 RepID=UPI00041A94F4|nr:DUF777 family protein [Borreliella garinii]
MNKEYEIYRMNQRLYGHALAQEDIKNWIYSNILITRIDIVKEFQKQTPEAIVTMPEFEGLEIHTKNISNIGFKLSKGDTVLLLQSNINLFDKNDDIHFDKHYFYIINTISPKALNLICDNIKIKANSTIEIANQTTSLKKILDNIISAINGITIIGDSVIDQVSRRIATSGIAADINSLFK